jgi:hypothetical protein
MWWKLNFNTLQPNVPLTSLRQSFEPSVQQRFQQERFQNIGYRVQYYTTRQKNTEKAGGHL